VGLITGRLCSEIRNEPYLIQADKLVADANMAVYGNRFGIQYKNQNQMDFERSVALHFISIAFIPWLMVWLFYRAVLYILMGKKSFVD
jgi:hypothetical protein